MNALLSHVTGRLIVALQEYILGGRYAGDLWEDSPTEIIHRVQMCIRVKETYMGCYRQMNEKLKSLPRGDCSCVDEHVVFQRLDLFNRRLSKLAELFLTISQFSVLEKSKIEGIEGILKDFKSLVFNFKMKQKDLLDFRKNKFDRDLVEFNVRINELEDNMLSFIDKSFESVSAKGIKASLALLDRFRAVFTRENLGIKLDEVYQSIYSAYGGELERTLELYEQQKENPPIPRHIPIVAGNIMWARLLLDRIEAPMLIFEKDFQVLNSKDKKVVKLYNRIVRTLVAFEYLWIEAWSKSIDAARAPLHATLLVRNPKDDQMYVNLDKEIFTLIREAKTLERMDIDIPEPAKILLLQEEKYKEYYGELQAIVDSYEEIVEEVIPVTAMLLQPHFVDIEQKIRPGMVTLCWTSMNIRSYIQHVSESLAALKQLVVSINDVVENRIELHLRAMSRCSFANFSGDSAQFDGENLARQIEDHVSSNVIPDFQSRVIEVHKAVQDLVDMVRARDLHQSIEPLSEEAIANFLDHYQYFLRQVILHATMRALNNVKECLFCYNHPLFSASVEIQRGKLVLHPDLPEIQQCVNGAVKAILSVSDSIEDYGHFEDEMDDESEERQPTVFDYVSRDLDVVRLVLLLSGSVKAAKADTEAHLASFDFESLWTADKDAEYAAFEESKPRCV
eukprot:scaffold57_cov254-Pinguiococcus_pyrenoidosus.AAC.40